MNLIPTATSEIVYTANLTNNVTISISALDINSYGACLLLLTSNTDGTNEAAISIAGGGTPKWNNGIAFTLAPKTGETVGLYIQSIAGTIFLSYSFWS